jgi:ABC-2 type transport system ATP-binding protein
MSDLAIRVEGLVKRFGELVALDGIDLEVPSASVYGLLGPNGAGKTTAIRVLATILHPDAGRAWVLGHDVVKEAAAVRRRIGLAGQYAAVDPNLTGTENLRMIGLLAQLPTKDVLPRAAELLGRFDLTDAADRPVRTYSGGMRRRLDIAASLVQKPPVLFLDEPTTGLDLTSRNELWEMIRELVEDGTTVLLTTQYLEEADRLSQKVAVIDGGHVIANDTPANLKAQLGSTVIELGFIDPATAERALKLIPAGVGRAELEGGLVRVNSETGAHALVEMLRSIDGDNVEPTTLTVREPSLDDVFLALTGHKAEQAVEDGNGDGEAASGGRGRRRARAGRSAA